ncbi:uncharacterized protein DNG_09100 [Cephalotrichum gorgonifer]|uniref:Nephrocystin 3-like N-terminal domain-containing protein n=1 Tax=Cephalotrichum gorgonifer TaxID=2041049 RepID=A0AAE8N512_9PEZI|nr:uncharacterized protein DNG_09100 [Cephalotrichum gorgonifer]
MSPNSMALSDSDSDAVMIDQDDISNYNPEQILPLTPEDIRKIRSWLQPTAYDIAGGEYRKHLASHVTGTGDWLTSSNTFQQWLHGSEHGLLWIKGIPGSGKSVIAANLIRELSKLGHPVLFFFFRQIIDANHEPQALLRDWMDQLLQYSPPLQEQLSTYIKDGRSIDSLSMDDMWKDLRMAFTRLQGKVFCVSDALDEMDLDRSHDEFLQALGSLGLWRPDTVKVLITSRPVPRVEIPLRTAPGLLRLRLEESQVDVDISTYVHSALSTSSIPQSEWKVIADAVPGRANGLFLYAKLAMDAFLESDGADISIISRLPADLNALYTDLLEEHARRSGIPTNVQNLILQSVTHATRPLRLLELSEMIRVCSPERSGSIRDLKSTKELIRTACGPLLEILADETVSVIHHSFTEYLKGTTRLEDGTGYTVLRAGPAHAELALACLRYLQSGCLKDGDGTDDEPDDGFHGSDSRVRLQYPFFDYAASNWGSHIRGSEAAGHDQTEVNAEVRKFLGQDETKAWIKIGWEHQFPRTDSVTQLHVAAKEGLLSYVMSLLETEENMHVDVRDPCGRTPLWWAANQGHAAVISALIAAGANPDQDCGRDGLTPLHRAASLNHFEAARVLLEAGVHPMTRKTREHPGRRCGHAARSTGHTPLMYACDNGHLETIDVFMPFLEERDTSYIQQALIWASRSGHAKVVARILQYPGLNVNEKIRGDTALFKACQGDDAETVRILLQAGADPHIECKSEVDEFAGVGGGWGRNAGSYLTCLYKLCSPARRFGAQVGAEIQREIFSMLVQAGADIHGGGPSGDTPLHSAASTSAILTRLLLDAGANPNAVNSFGAAPLHLVTSEESLVALVEGSSGVDLNPRDAEGRTPLLRLLELPSESIVLKFLEYMPDCNVIDNAGDGALHTLLRKSTSPAIVKALLEAGADPNLKNSKGLTPILTIRQHSDHIKEVVDILVQAGANIDAVDEHGRTVLALRLSSNKGPSSSRFGDEENKKPHQDIIHLIDRGASTACRDLDGRTLLHETIGCLMSSSRPGTEPDLSTLAFLVDQRLDVQAVDNRGNGLLHELALLSDNHHMLNGLDSSLGLVPIWKNLIAYGLDLEQGNHAGRTPLHILSAASNVGQVAPGYIMPIDFVISQTRDVDKTDKDGNTALHLAVTSGEIETYTKKLLEAGADPAAATHEGLTPLHLASRSRYPNIAGLLLDALRARQGITTGEPVAGVNAKTFNGSNLTPLYYACRSGRPETVKLLLEAGTDVKGCSNIFQACVDFEEEDALWWKPHVSEDGPGNGDAVGLKLDDKSRRGSDKRVSESGMDYSRLGVHESTRLAEILSMLAKHGADLSQLDSRPWTCGAIEAAVKAGREYTAACLMDLQRVGVDGEKTRELTRNPDLPKLIDQILPEAASQALRDCEALKPRLRTPELVRRCVARREYRLVEELATLGMSFLPNRERGSLHDRNTASYLSFLIRNGFASLVESIGSLEALEQSRLCDPEWHAFGDETQPGLWFAKEGEPGAYYASFDFNPKPFILEAVERALPNMEVLRLLVEKFRIDISEVWMGGSALHSVASGASWWQVNQALPYLLQAGADVDAQAHPGRTPLHMALKPERGSRGPFGREAAKMLIEAGANVNAIDDYGKSCLARAGDDIVMVELLISHGATVNADALFAAIEAKNVSVLRALLSGGADPNIRREKPQPGNEPLKREKKRPRKSRWNRDRSGRPTLPDYVGPSEIFPLYSAALTSSALVRVLLERGADPFATFLIQTRNKKSGSEVVSLGNGVPEGYKECTVLHQLLLVGSHDVDTILSLPGLDVNHRDARGLTLLMAACGGFNGPDHPSRGASVNLVTESEQSVTDNDSEAEAGEAGGAGSTTIFRRLLSLGSDLSARDNRGRNALHHMIGGSYHYDSFQDSFSEALLLAPELVNQSDINGKTPLLYAASSNSLTKAKIANALLSAGADPLSADENGDTALHFLAHRLYTAEIRALFEGLVARGADVNSRNARGETPLFPYCVRTQEQEQEYLNRDEDEDEDDDQGERISEAEATPMLVALGADFFAMDARGRGLLHVAASGGAGRFKELMGVGLDPMLEDGAQRTAVDVAAACENSDVLALFEKKDGDREKKRLRLVG